MVSVTLGSGSGLRMMGSLMVTVTQVPRAFFCLQAHSFRRARFPRTARVLCTGSLLDHGASLRLGTRAVLGCRAAGRRHLQLVDGAHQEPRRLHPHARCDERLPVALRHQWGALGVLALA